MANMDALDMSSTMLLQRYFAESAKKSFMIRDILQTPGDDALSPMSKVAELCGTSSRHLLRRATAMERRLDYLERLEKFPEPPPRQVLRPQARLPGDVPGSSKFATQGPSNLLLHDGLCLPQLSGAVGLSPSFIHGNYAFGTCSDVFGMPFQSGSAALHMPLYLGSGSPTLDEHTGKQKKCRRSRTVFTELQLMGLEKRFDVQKYLSTPDRIELAEKLGLSQLQVKTWYQNRRMKWKKQVLQGGGLEAPTKPKGRPKKNSIPPSVVVTVTVPSPDTKSPDSAPLRRVVSPVQDGEEQNEDISSDSDLDVSRC